MISNGSSVRKPNSVTYKISLLQIHPLSGRQIKIESSDGGKDLSDLQNNSYEIAQILAPLYAHNITIYKVATRYSYYWE